MIHLTESYVLKGLESINDTVYYYYSNYLQRAAERTKGYILH